MKTSLEYIEDALEAAAESAKATEEVATQALLVNDLVKTGDYPAAREAFFAASAATRIAHISSKASLRAAIASAHPGLLDNTLPNWRAGEYAAQAAANSARSAVCCAVARMSLETLVPP
jgi:hypothetical protein